MYQSTIKKINSLILILKSSLKHPLNKDSKIKTIIKIISFFLKKRLNSKKEIIISWVENSKFIYTHKDRQLKWNVYHGLADFAEMMFLLHVLRSKNLFIDVGANIGIYTILASKVVGSKSICFEPHPITHKRLIKNINLNSIEHLVKNVTKGMGSNISQKKFSNFLDDRGPLNKISTNSKNKDDITIEITTLDNEINTDNEYLVKIDVEGYEYHVLNGGKKTLQDNKLIGIIIETNLMSEKYGHSIKKISDFFKYYGLIPINYNPIKREIKIIKNLEFSKNTIFIKDFDKIELLVKQAKKFKINTAFNKYL